MKRRPGFTLIEAMVIIATAGLVIASAVATWRRATDRTPPNNAARDLVAQMQRARARAAERNSDVWLFVYPSFNKRTNAPTEGRGAWFVIEDTHRDFNPAAFDPTGTVLAAGYLEKYAGKLRLKLKQPRLKLEPTDAPFDGLEITSSCTFCSGGHGAVVFSPDNSIRFVNGEGASVDGGSHAVVLISERNKATTVIAVEGASGFIGAYPQ